MQTPTCLSLVILVLSSSGSGVAAAARWTRQDRLLEMRTMLKTTTQASWVRLGERLALYENQLVPEAQSNSEASFRAYQAGKSPMGPFSLASRSGRG